MANHKSVKSLGLVTAHIRLKSHPNREHILEFTVLPNCLHDLILGQPFCRLFSGINFTYNGSGPALDLSNSKVNRHALCLAQARVKAPKLFLGLNGNERPI